MIVFLQVMAEIAKKAKPTTTAELLTAAIEYAFTHSRDGRLAVASYLRSLEGDV